MQIKHDIAGTIRKAFRKSGMSMKRLSDQSGVHYSGVHRIIAETGDLKTGTASRLLSTLGLQIVATKRKGK